MKVQLLVILLILFSCDNDEESKKSPPFITAKNVITLTPEINGGTGGLAVDDSGNIYIGDFGPDLNGGGDKVFKVSPEGNVSIFAQGLFGASGNQFDSQGNLYQSNISASRISKITPDGQVSTFVESGLVQPVGIAIDKDDNLYVCNCGNNTIQKVTPAKVSTLFASSSLFNCPNGIALADDGNLYVANFVGGKVLRVSPGGSVSSFVTIVGSNNGHITYFEGNLYVAARGANRIYGVSLSGTIKLIAGDGSRGVKDGPALNSGFSLPNDLAFSQDGKYMYVNDAVSTTGATVINPMVLRRIELK
ncbi:MAG: hypothetical protein KDD94_09945 [Calditrichaeota bacterium]|nr:hypothetical protein [Calditrichota bacterium]